MGVMRSDPESQGFTCCLIPNTPSLELADEIAEITSTELQQICLSNGWKLEFFKVDTQYLQWAVSVRPTVTVMDVIFQVRSDLNNKILPSYLTL